MNSWAWAIFAARTISSIEAFGMPKAMLLAIVSLKRNDSWKTRPIDWRSDCSRNVSQVRAVDQDPAGIGVVEARQQRQQGGLP